MGSINKRGSRLVPWGWVMVSAYCTVLACVAFSQLTSPDFAVALIRDYQTLIAGLATIAALLIAAQQLKRQEERDFVDAIRHYQTELDALAALNREARILDGFAWEIPIHSGRLIPFDEAKWLRLLSEAHMSLVPAIRQAMDAIQDHNRLLDRPSGIYLTFDRFTDRQLAELRVSFRAASHQLSAAVEVRRNVVRELIESAR
jgi:hypothetical protein